MGGAGKVSSLGVGPGLPLMPSFSGRAVPLRTHGVELVSAHRWLPSEAQEGEARVGRGWEAEALTCYMTLGRPPPLLAYLPTAQQRPPPKPILTPGAPLTVKDGEGIGGVGQAWGGKGGSEGGVAQPLAASISPAGRSGACHLLTFIQGEASPQGLELGPLHKQRHALVTPNLLIYKSSRDMR